MKKKKTLEELQAANLPVAKWADSKWADFMDVAGEPMSSEDDAALTKYLSQFLPPNEKCVSCGRSQGGILGAFQWGLVHGEGFCSCGYPARVYHRNIGPIKRMDLILQYHPSGLSRQETESA